MPRRMMLLIVVAIAQSFLEGASLMLLLPVLGSLGIGQMGGGAATEFVRGLFGAVGIPYTLATTLGFLVVVALIAAVTSFYATVLADKILRRVITNMRLDAYAALVFSTAGFAARTRMGDATAVLTKFAEQCGVAFIGLVRVMTGLLVVFVLIGVAVAQSWQFVVAVLGLIAVGAVPFWLSSRATQRQALKAQAYVREVSVHVTEHLRLLPSIRALGTQLQSLKMLAGHVKTSEAAVYALKRRTAAIKSSIDPMLLALLALALYFGATVFHLGFDRLLLLVGVFVRLVPAVMRIVVQNQQLSMQLAAYHDIVTFISDGRAAAEPKRGKPLPEDPLREGVVLRDVVTADGDTTILKGVSLELRRGRIIGLVGPSGSGKTSIVNAVLGLADIRNGSVVIGGVPLAELDLGAWRRRVGYVSQSPPVFSSTVRENLAFWQEDAREAQMWNVLGDVGLRDAIRALPAGLDQSIGEQGNLLSGGQRHRLAIAGALLRNPLLLILDEPTSALDPESTRVIIDLLEQRRAEIAVLIIAHDLDVVRNADEIYVLDDGRIGERGSWDGLVKAGGRLFRLAGMHGRS